MDAGITPPLETSNPDDKR